MANIALVSVGVNRIGMRMIDEMNGIAMMIRDARSAIPVLQLLRALEPERPLVLIYEDFDSLVQINDEHTLLALLDGEYQIGNVIHVATTNYPERLEARWVNRPGRFDRVITVGPPIAAAREFYVRAKAPSVSDKAIARWVGASNGWSVAHMREFIVAHHIMGEKDDEVIARFNAMRDKSWFKGMDDTPESVDAQIQERAEKIDGEAYELANGTDN